MAEYINIKHWYDMYSKISKRVLEITVELANYDNPVLTREDYIKEGELIALNAVKFAMVDGNVLPEDVAPPANFTPAVHGRWIESDHGSYVCSMCGEDWVLNDGTPAENNMNYCPRCGARMEEKRYD